MAFQYEVAELSDGRVAFQTGLSLTAWNDVSEQDKALLTANLEASPIVFHTLYNRLEKFKGNFSTDPIEMSLENSEQILKTDPDLFERHPKILHKYIVIRDNGNITLKMNLSLYNNDHKLVQQALELIHLYAHELKLRLKNNHVVIELIGKNAKSALNAYKKTIVWEDPDPIIIKTTSVIFFCVICMVLALFMMLVLGSLWPVIIVSVGLLGVGIGFFGLSGFNPYYHYHVSEWYEKKFPGTRVIR